MTSTITDRVNGAVAGVAVTTGFGILATENVAGTNTVTADTTPTISGYVTNMYASIRPANNNTGPVDINLGEGGLVNLLKPNGDELAADEFNTALEYLIRFNGTEFRIVTPSF